MNTKYIKGRHKFYESPRKQIIKYRESIFIPPLELYRKQYKYYYI